jgi:hypothetical protein
MFADIGNLIGLLIFVVIAIVSALMKKKQKDEEQTFELPPELKPRRDRSQQPPPSRSWEEELRHLLEDRPPPPPVVQHVPPPPPMARPPVAEPVWAETYREVVLPPPQPRIEPVIYHRPAELSESEESFSPATHLQERVAEHMGELLRHRVGTTSVHRRAAAPEVTEAVKLVRSPRGVRAALIASIILGPPRALEG